MIFKAPKTGCGIYAIVNSTNGKIYVGKTKNFYARFKHYDYDFREKRTRQINNFLMTAMEKDGYENFNFINLEICEKEELFSKELFWIEKLKSSESEFGYNLRKDTLSGMVTHSSTSEKISNRLKKEWSDGKRDGHSKKLKANWEDNPYRKVFQSDLFSKIKTKYEYVVTKDGKEWIVLYKDLHQYGLKDVGSYFHRKKSDDVICKGYRVIRKKINE